MREFVVGSIKGASDYLMQILSKINYDPSGDKIIFLGNYTGSTDNNIKTIEFINSLQLENTNVITLLGDIDDGLKTYLDCQFEYTQWILYGGHKTKKEYAKKWTKYRDSHLDFLDNCSYHYVDQYNNYYTHSGFDISSKVFTAATDAYTIKEDMFWPNLLKKHEEESIKIKEYTNIFISHKKGIWPVNIKNPNNYKNVWNLEMQDKRILCMDIETKEIFKSESII